MGKTTIAKEILLELKNKGINCAFISEDNFRKKMQFKYKAEDKQAHLNSAELITSVVKKLLTLDSYEIIVIEGLFRYKQMLKLYDSFCKNEEYDLKIFQLEAPLEVRKKRNVQTTTRDHVANLESSHGKGKGEEIRVKDAIIIDATKPIKHSVNSILRSIKL